MSGKDFLDDNNKGIIHNIFLIGKLDCIKIKTPILWKTWFKEWKDKLLLGEKYSQIMYVIKDLNPEHRKNPQNSIIICLNLYLKSGQERHFRKKDIRMAHTHM